MAIRIGLDLGSSVVKLAAVSGRDIVATHKQDSDAPVDPDGLVESFLAANGLARARVDGIALTGVGARRIASTTLAGLTVEQVDEFSTTARGALELSGRGGAVVASMGTGTAFLHAADGAVRHLGGSGVGGGTLMGLCRKFYNLQTFEEVVAVSLDGNLERVDLRIKDFADNEYIHLSPDLTASNFAKSLPGASMADMVLGFINMVLETAGVMAVMGCRATGAPCAVLTGSLLRLPQAAPVYAAFARNYGVEFILPPRAAFATAIGAALLFGHAADYSGLA